MSDRLHLLPGVCLDDEVMPIKRPHLQLGHKLNVVVQQLQFVEQILHHQEWKEGVTSAALVEELVEDLRLSGTFRHRKEPDKEGVSKSKDRFW